MSWQLSTTHEPIEVRSAYGATLEELINEGVPVMACDADLAQSSGAWNIFTKYPDHAVDFGICEAAMISAAAAMSRTGLRPYAHTFAPFASRRVADQIYISAAFAQQDLHIYASDPGYWSLYNGATHTAFEDIAMMRSIPGMTVVVPSDAVSFAWVLRWYAEHGGVIFNRAPRKPVPQLYAQGSTFEYGKGQLLREGSDVALVALGESVADALEAADRLEEQGILASVIDLFFVKPVDADLVTWAFSNHRAVVTIENHSVYGGIGELVGGMMASAGAPARLGMVGVRDRFGEVGDKEYLKRILHLTVDDIVATATKTLGAARS